jgi:hypothetical protein
MHAPEQRHSASGRTLFARSFVVFSCTAFVFLISCFPLISSSADAQDYGHMRVQFSHGAAWTDTAPRPDSTPLPPGPARAGYGYAHNAESGAPNDRVRLKASNFNGM